MMVNSSLGDHDEAMHSLSNVVYHLLNGNERIVEDCG